MEYFCPYCGNYTGGKFNWHLRHIKYHHSHEANFSITYEDCGQTFKKFESFKSHARRKHNNQEVRTLLEPLDFQDREEVDEEPINDNDEGNPRDTVEVN